MVVKLKRETAPENVVAKESSLVSLGERLLATLVDLPDFAVDVVVASRAPHRVCGNRHALEHGMRVVAHEVAILERAGLALVRVADQVFFAFVLLRDDVVDRRERRVLLAAAEERHQSGHQKAHERQLAHHQRHPLCLPLS